MTKREFINLLARKNSFSPAFAEKILNAFLASVEDALFRDGRIALPGFGVFAAHTAPERTGRNPQTGEEMQIPKSNKIAFRASQSLKDMLN